MKEILIKINSLQQELKDLSPMKPEFQEKLDKKIRLEFNYNSNHIEGNTLSYNETKLLLLSDVTAGDNHTLREYEEMKAHDITFLLLKNLVKDNERPFSEQNIKEFNKIILVRPFWKDAITPSGEPTKKEMQVGDYKTSPNSVRLENGEMFEYASVGDTPILMHELLVWLREEEDKKELPPVALAALFHYKFVRIHPFDDGNGRISRLLMNYVIMKNDLPPIVIKSADKRNYLLALRRADAGDLDFFVNYIATQLIWSLELSIKAAKGESIDEKDDLDKEIALLKQSLKKEDVLKIKKDHSVIFTTISDNIIPLFKLVEEKGKGLEELFFEIRKKVMFPYGLVERYINLDIEHNKWDIKIIAFGHSEIMPINNMHLNYQLGKFRKHINSPSFHLDINIVFEAYRFTITFPDGEAKAFPYGKKFTEDELISLIKPMFDSVMRNIIQAGKEDN